MEPAVYAALHLRRGGRHQQAAQSAAAGPRVQAAVVAARSRSHLAQQLLQMWAWGALTAAMLQTLARCAEQDGVQCPALQALASLGARGEHPQNCQRDLKRLLLQWLPPPVPPVTVRVPMKTAKHAVAVVQENVCYVPLHRQLHYKRERFPAQWMEHVLGGGSDCSAFWNSVRRDDCRWRMLKPLLDQRAAARDESVADSLRKCIPLAVHADGVPVFKGKSLVVLSANSVLSNSSASAAKFLLGVHWKSQMLKGDSAANDTERALWQCVLWDLNSLFVGAHPLTNHSGEQWPAGSDGRLLAGAALADSWWAVLWIFKGDLDHFANHLGLEHWATDTPCPWCRADRTDALWTDFRDGAPWKQTVWTGALWRAAARPQRHPVFQLPYFSIANIAIDVLHVLSLGVAQHIAGSVLHTLCWETLSGRPANNLQRVWDGIQDFYIAHNVTTQLSKLTFSMFCDANAPHSRFAMATTKGKETEYLCLALEHVWAEQCDPTSAHDISVATVLGSVAAIYNLARTPAQGSVCQLDHAAWRELVAAVDTLLLHFTALANHASARGVLRWNVAVKHHILWHWAQQARVLHPCRSACYIDEHFCGVVATICKSSTAGKRIARVGETVLFKWQTGVLLQCASEAAGAPVQWGAAPNF